MLNGLLISVAKMVYGRKILEVVAGLHDKVIGYRSEIIIGLVVIISAAQHLGLVDSKIADTAINCLLGALPITLASKVGNVLKKAGNVFPQIVLPPEAKSSEAKPTESKPS